MKSKIEKTKSNLSLRLAFLMLTVLLGIGTARAATFTATNTNDSGAGSLRQAILDANVSSDADTINFNLSVCPCAITLTSGELVITEDLTIQGTGANQLTVSGNNSSTVFSIINATVTLDGLKISGGGNGNVGFLGTIGGGIYTKTATTLSKSGRRARMS